MPGCEAGCSVLSLGSIRLLDKHARRRNGTIVYWLRPPTLLDLNIARALAGELRDAVRVLPLTDLRLRRPGEQQRCDDKFFHFAVPGCCHCKGSTAFQQARLAAGGSADIGTARPWHQKPQRDSVGYWVRSLGLTLVPSWGPLFLRPQSVQSGALLAFRGQRPGAQATMEPAATRSVQISPLARRAGARLGATRQVVQIVRQRREIRRLWLQRHRAFETALCPSKERVVVGVLSPPVIVKQASALDEMGTPTSAASSLTHVQLGRLIVDLGRQGQGHRQGRSARRLYSPGRTIRRVTDISMGLSPPPSTT